jgi:hypothetical protein
MISAFDDSVLQSEGESRVDIWVGGLCRRTPWLGQADESKSKDGVGSGLV